jgi:glycosyltransferase involved in cell wall biosynthesis
VKKLISVVAGCFNEEGNVDELVQRVRTVFSGLPQYRWEIILIDNASTDRTADRLRVLAAADERVKVIFNARNFGHIRSPYYALTVARGDAAISLASDLQDPPEMIPQFLAKWEEGFQAVVGVKESSEESAALFMVRRCYYKLVHRLADVEIIQNCTGFGLYDQRIVSLCRDLDDPYPYFRGMISEFGLPTARLSYRQPTRKRGLTKNNFYTLYDLAMLGLTNHSKVPLRLATMLGFAMAFCSLLVACVYFVFKLVFWYDFPMGMAPVSIGLFLFCSIQLFFIGVLGEYIGAIHTQVLKRPLVVESERLNFESPNTRVIPEDPAVTSPRPARRQRRGASHFGRARTSRAEVA